MSSMNPESRCVFCQKVERSESDLKDHLIECCKNENAKKKRHGCPDCSYRTDRLHDLSKHRLRCAKSKKLNSVVSNPIVGSSRESVSSQSDWEAQDPGSCTSLISPDPTVRKQTRPSKVSAPQPNVEQKNRSLLKTPAEKKQFVGTSSTKQTESSPVVFSLPTTSQKQAAVCDISPIVTLTPLKRLFTTTDTSPITTSTISITVPQPSTNKRSATTLPTTSITAAKSSADPSVQATKTYFSSLGIDPSPKESESITAAKSSADPSVQATKTYFPSLGIDTSPKESEFCQNVSTKKRVKRSLERTETWEEDGKNITEVNRWDWFD